MLAVLSVAELMAFAVLAALAALLYRTHVRHQQQLGSLHAQLQRAELHAGHALELAEQAMRGQRDLEERMIVALRGCEHGRQALQFAAKACFRRLGTMRRQNLAVLADNRRMYTALQQVHQAMHEDRHQLASLLVQLRPHASSSSSDHPSGAR